MDPEISLESFRGHYQDETLVDRYHAGHNVCGLSGFGPDPATSWRRTDCLWDNSYGHVHVHAHPFHNRGLRIGDARHCCRWLLHAGSEPEQPGCLRGSEKHVLPACERVRQRGDSCGGGFPGIPLWEYSYGLAHNCLRLRGSAYAADPLSHIHDSSPCRRRSQHNQRLRQCCRRNIQRIRQNGFHFFQEAGRLAGNRIHAVLPPSGSLPHQDVHPVPGGCEGARRAGHEDRGGRPCLRHHRRHIPSSWRHPRRSSRLQDRPQEVPLAHGGMHDAALPVIRVLGNSSAD